MTILNFLLFCLAVSFYCVGFHAQIGEGGALSWYGKTIARLPQVLNKPLGLCLECMASIHGVIWWFLLGYDFGPLLILAIPIISTFNILIHSKID